MLTFVAALSLSAQEPWQLKLKGTLTGGFHTYSDSWVGKEKGNVVWNSSLFLDAQKQFSEKFRQENSLALEFGQTFIKEIDSISKEKTWSEPQISSDNIDFNNREILTLAAVSPFFGFRAQSSFLNKDTTNTLVKYGNPVNLTQSLGISKKLLTKVEKQSLELRLSAAAKQNINREMKTHSDGGIEWITAYEAEHKKGFFGYKTNLNLYKALAVSDSALRKAKMESVDVEWENNAWVNLNRFVVISYASKLLYNRYFSEDVRVQNSLTAGFNIVKSSDEPKKE